MLPQTPLASPTTSSTTGPPPRHESINDLPVHASTLRQLFQPTSESRAFTRADAGAAFSRHLAPADARIPHPAMIAGARDAAAGVPEAERRRRMRARLDEEAAQAAERERARAEREASRARVVKGRRWDFRFEEVSVESVGRDGRAPGGVGWRYGVPHEDRKKGQVKIPTSVE